MLSLRHIKTSIASSNQIGVISHDDIWMWHFANTGATAASLQNCRGEVSIINVKHRILSFCSQDLVITTFLHCCCLTQDFELIIALASCTVTAMPAKLQIGLFLVFCKGWKRFVNFKIVQHIFPLPLYSFEDCLPLFVKQWPTRVFYWI